MKTSNNQGTVVTVSFASRALVLALGAMPFIAIYVHAQEEGAPETAPSRPVVLQMTPGSSLRPQPPAVKNPVNPQKPKILPVPPASRTGAITNPERSARPDKLSPNDYTFCNRTSYAVTIAVGIKNGALLATRGWWIIPAGECKVVIKGPLTQSTYFSFARSSFAHTGPIRTWGGTNNLCTGKGNFQASGDGTNQCGPGYVAQGFAKVDTSGNAGWLTTLSENSSFKNMEQARVAGLQRLLSDIGTFTGPIDGIAGPKFNEALAQIRAALSVSASDAAGLYNKLHAEATRLQTAAGLTFCNRTQDIIWTAFGKVTQDKTQSKGWYRLQPEQCEKVIKERLTEPFIYAFGAAERSEGVPETWGGNKPFCTKESTFDFDDSTNCPGKGFTSTGFFQIDTLGRAGVVFEFISRAPAPE